MTYFKKMKITTLLLLLFSTLPALSANYSANTILAKVNGENITLGHVIAAVARLPEEYETMEPRYLLNGILDQIVKQELMAQSLDTSKELMKISIENEVRSIRAKYAVEEKLQGFPNTETIAAAYEEATKSMENMEEFNASHILLENEKDALEIIKLLELGEDFSKLAQEKSTGPSGPNGGQLGWFGYGQMVPEFETAVMVLEIGKVSQPVKTQFGWHIIKLNDRRIKSPPTLEELQPELVEKLSQNRIDQLIQIANEKATITLLNEEIDPFLIRDLDLLRQDN